jgi:flagellar biosynthesis component FlhA
LASALTQPGASGPLVDSVTSGIGTVTDFWAVLPVVEGAITDPDAEAGARATAVTIRDRLGDRLDHLLLLDPDDAESPDVIPIVTPIVLEVSDLLVPIVDSRQDGGRFLYELIPAMRERITESTGLAIPGVRARGNPGLPPGGFVIQIDEIPRIEASMRPDGHYTARADAGEAYPAEGEVTEIHPVTSALGRWLIKHHPEDEIPDLEPAATFTPAEYLSHRIERVIRADLGKFLGMQEFQALLERWRDDDPVPVVRLLGNRALGQSMAEERLKVLLQDLVAERVPITDWRAVLASVVTAGGIETDLRVLHRAIRLQLREALPGWRSGPMLEVPGPIQTALSGQEIVDRKSADAAHTEQARLQFLNWLHGIIGQYGPVISLIAHDAEIRETVALLARTERAVVATFSAEEVTTA